jgi:hypothetical protein
MYYSFIINLLYCYSDSHRWFISIFKFTCEKDKQYFKCQILLKSIDWLSRTKNSR